MSTITISSSLPLGSAAPSFDLPGVDGRQHTLADYADKAVLVVVFTCNHCPYAQGWEGRLIALQNTYAERGVAFVLINANDPVKYPADNFEAMKERASAQGYPFAYLQDTTQSVARAYGATRTPEVFVFNADRKLVYHGAPDDNVEPDQVTKHYLRDAIEAALAGQAAPVADTPPVGCTIKWQAA
jgi:peroxiredoxin